jgi:hypothetical protein
MYSFREKINKYDKAKTLDMINKEKMSGRLIAAARKDIRAWGYIKSRLYLFLLTWQCTVFVQNK